MGYFLQLLINATFISVLYGLLAVSYVLIHGLTRRINLAFGALAIVAGYTTISTAIVVMLLMPGEPMVAVAAGALVGVVHTGLIGGIIDRTVARPLLRAGSLAVLVATLGLAIALEEAVRLAYGSRELWLPPLRHAPLEVGGTAAFPVQVSVLHIIVAALSALVAAGLLAFISRHPFGRLWRAAAEDVTMAELCGVDVGRVLTITLVLACALAGFAGAMIAVAYGVASFYGGFVIGLKTLFVAVVGGLGSVGGALAGGFILGIFETLWSGYAPLGYRDVAALSLLALLLIAFPQGLGSPSSRQPPV
ncbi:MAG TPA: branched-chain amino acid ABC transporter permease [Hyphomicrobiaceae bacterium]|nr:branched-chain amino acid ABC transporter permease [Hyphomicrobiaceae bacterium]